MFTRQPENETLSYAITHATEHLFDLTPGSDEYNIVVQQIEKLHALKSTDSKKRVSPDTLVNAAASLAGILIIVGHERAHVVTSKALGFVLKLK